MKGLNRVHECRSVVLLKNILSNLEDVIGTHSKKVAIESGVMQLAQGKSIADNGFAEGFRIADDVSGVEQFLVP